MAAGTSLDCQGRGSYSFTSAWRTFHLHHVYKQAATVVLKKLRVRTPNPERDCLEGHFSLETRPILAKLPTQRRLMKLFLSPKLPYMDIGQWFGFHSTGKPGAHVCLGFLSTITNWLV
jgi:hypothetical protein